MALTQKININTNWLLLGGLLIGMVFSLCVGAYALSWGEFWSVLLGDYKTNQTPYFLIMNIRLPRICLGVLVGSGLAISGMAVQTIFRNPLAEPTLIGISSGAMLFAVFFYCSQRFFTF